MTALPMTAWTMRANAAFLLAPVLALAIHPELSAQNPQELLAEAMERHATRLDDVEDVTIHQEVMGIAVTTHLVKETVDGTPVLRPVDLGVAGIDTGPIEDVGELWADPQMLYAGAADRWELEGSGSIDGRPTWQLLLTEAGDIDWGPGPDEPGALRPERIELVLDAEELVPRLITISGEMDRRGETAPFSLRVEMSEYREVNGYLHPYLTSIETDFEASGLSDEEVAEARQALEGLQNELEAMPESQRAIVQQALAPQIEMLQEMLAGESLRMEVRVTDVRVNEGRPDGS